jgi:transcriptional regulator with XRE-family HTH domain
MPVMHLADVSTRTDWASSSLSDRIQHIQRVISEREGKRVSLNELGRRAGVGVGVMSRLGSTTGAVHRSPETLRRVAESLGFSLEWLTYGHGEPEPTKTAAGVEQERFPHRATAARIARDGGIDPRAVDAVLQREYVIDRDPSILWWLHEIERHALLLHGAHPTPVILRDDSTKK